MTKKVVVLDYGSGNLRSAQRALQRVGADVEVSSDAAAAQNADGLVVLGELGCVNCHRAEGPAAALLPPKQGPVLDGVGSRVRRSFLRKFLTNPPAARPGTTMPHLLAGLSIQETEQRVDALEVRIGALGHRRRLARR